jgi:hypothetical protein
MKLDVNVLLATGKLKKRMPNWRDFGSRAAGTAASAYSALATPDKWLVDYFSSMRRRCKHIVAQHLECYPRVAPIVANVLLIQCWKSFE